MADETVDHDEAPATATSRPKVDGRAPRVPPPAPTPRAEQAEQAASTAPTAPAAPAPDRAVAGHGLRALSASLASERPSPPVDADPPAAPPEGVGGAGPDPTDAPQGDPAPPSPPFVAAEAPFAWQVVLPGSLGRSLTIRIGPDAIDLGGTVVPRDQVAAASFRLEVEDALLRRAASARLRIELTTTDGTRVKVAARNAASASRAAAIVSTVTYLWTLLGDVEGEDPRSVVERIQRGAEVVVGGVRATAIGVAWKRHAIVPWASVGDVTLEGLEVIVRTDDEPLVVPLTVDGAFMLPELLPLLRDRFG